MIWGVLGLGTAIAASTLVPATADARTVLVPAATTDARENGRAVAVLAGGCFWGVEAVFSHLRGVQSVTSGYAGGTERQAKYDIVSSETTRHAEAVRIVYDPAKISYATLLRVYFSVAHDPTQLNRQTPDTGRSYRSAVFPQTGEQARVARAYVAQLNGARSWGAPIATAVESGQFFAAEAYHQDFAFRNPSHPYIIRWDAPKVAALQRTFPALWSAKPAA